MRYIVLPILLTFSCFSFCYASNWQELNATQQQALAPLSAEWSKLPKDQQNQLLDLANSYHLLNAEQKVRLHQRLTTWAKLSPEQRNAAREKYRAFSGVPESTQQEVKQMMKGDQ